MLLTDLLNGVRLNEDNKDIVKKFLRRIGTLRGTYLAGGAARTLVTNEPVVDFDLFFVDRKSADATRDHLISLGAEEVFRCADQLITMRLDGFKVQLITKTFHDDVNDLLSRFDFTLCQFGAYLGDASPMVVYPDLALEDAIAYNLRLNNLQYPVASAHRIQKYIRKGYKAADWQWFWQDFFERASKIDVTEENMALYID